jgi:nifR3 family TIM-barrel protein
MRIGTLPLENRVLLAPMAGVTNRPFRVMARRNGCALTATEMLSADFLLRQTPEEREVHRVVPEERPMALQIMGSDPGVMAEAARICEDLGADVVDVNMGCPVKKVVGRGGGAALLRDASRAGRIVESMARAVRIPVTAKIRAGWEDGCLSGPDVARTLEAAGVAALAVHGRTREQQYRGRVNLDLIAEVKGAVSVPVVANGDVLTPGDARRTLEATGADAVMIGRGAVGNLWIFRAAVAVIEGLPEPPRPSAEERLAEFREHLDRLLAAEGEWLAVRRMRKYAPYYATGVAGARAFRAAVNHADTVAAVLDLAERLFRGEAEGVRAAEALGVTREEVLAVAAAESAETRADLASRGETAGDGRGDGRGRS